MQQAGHNQRKARVAPPEGPVIGHEPCACTDCWGCVRHCPSNALKFVDGHTEIIPERCVKCGACVHECGNVSMQARNDLGSVRELLSGDLPVIALLASEYVAAMHPMTRSELENALASAGFSGIETTVLGEEIVAAAYDRYVARDDGGLPRLRSTCPVAVEWVRRFYPQLTGALVPVLPPYIVQARLVREIYPDEVAIVYMSPCYARKDEIYAPDLAGDVDVAIGFNELRQLLSEKPGPDVSLPATRRPYVARENSAIDGFPRRVLASRSQTASDICTVRGLDDIDRLLSAITRGETAPSVVDMLCCEGCIDGPCVNSELSVFAKRTIDAAEHARQAPPVVDTKSLLSTLPPVNLHRRFKPKPAPVREPSAEEVDAVLAAGEFESRAEVLDCGACGYDTCVEHAVAIWEGHSSWELCFPLQKKILVREREHFSAASVTDDLTGLMNRRAFNERLTQEVNRARRYNTPLSLVMIDLDAFKEVNDQYGHSVGDSLLRAVGVLLLSELRSTDLAVRYGGDEFALILPGTTKTDAWAVAEKIRASMRGLVVEATEGVRMGTTVSIGVAAVTDQTTDAEMLLELSDAALYRAKRAGRDRVELAAG